MESLTSLEAGGEKKIQPFISFLYFTLTDKTEISLGAACKSELCILLPSSTQSRPIPGGETGFVPNICSV